MRLEDIPQQYFRRQDESSDFQFYQSPRLVAHIDDAAIAALGAFFRRLSGRVGKVKAVTATARKIAVLAELFGVKTAWHGPGDVSPIGHMAQITLDITSTNFGIQEYSPFSTRAQEIFHGCPQMRDGYLYVNEKPGWGIEIDEAAAAKAPFTESKNGLNGGWGEIRRLDGGVIKQ